MPVKLSEKDPKHINVNVKYVVVSLVNVPRKRTGRKLDARVDQDVRVDLDDANP